MMDKRQREYYDKMLLRDRAFTFYVGDRLGCLITYYIGNGNMDRYTKRDPWTVIDDEPETGTTCYVDQLITDHNKENRKYAWTLWHVLIQYIKEKYPQVERLKWKRYNHKMRRINVHSKDFRR